MANDSAIGSEVPAAAAAPDLPDPRLLGVELPLKITISAAKTVVDAWKVCFLALSAAAKAKLPVKKDTGAVPPPPPTASA